MKSLFFYFDESEKDPRLSAALDEMLSGSDRAVAILGAALVDAQLISAIQRKFEGKDYVKNALNGREFLASFSARITTARMLGLFSDRLAADLNTVRKIRNAFAHDPLAMNFSTPSVADRCRTLTVPEQNIVLMGEVPEDNRSFIAVQPDDLKRDDPRFRYIATCAFFSVIASAAASYSAPFDFPIAND